MLLLSKAVVEDQTAFAEIYRSVFLGEGSHACCVFFQQAKTMLVHQVDPVVTRLQIHVMMPTLPGFGMGHAYIFSALEGSYDVLYVFGLDMLDNFMAVNKFYPRLHVLLRQV